MFTIGSSSQTRGVRNVPPIWRREWSRSIEGKTFMDARVLELRRQEADERKVRIFVRNAGRSGADAAAIVWAALELIERAERTKERDRKRGAAAIICLRKHPKGAMPDVVRSRDELAEAAQFAAEQGDTAADWCNDNELAAARELERLLRAALVGENPDRDWKILLSLAAGKSERALEKHFGESRANIRKRRDKQVAAFAKVLHCYLDAPAWTAPIGQDSRLIQAAA
jgi:hypothetical protein